MNEQIKELWDRAAKQTGERKPPYDGTWEQQVEFLNTFAEMIVKETLQVARAGIEFGDGMEDAVYNYFGIQQ